MNENIRVRGGNIIADYTMAAERATGIFKNLEGRYVIRVKFIREQAPGVWVYEDAFAPLKQGRTRGDNVLEVTSETQPGALVGIHSVLRQHLPG